MDDVLLATSLSPRDLERQQRALRSWSAAGFRLVSLNDPSEVDALAGAGYGLDLPVVRVSVAPYFGKRLPLIDDFVRYFLAQMGFRYAGIINSDIALVDADRLKAALRAGSASLVFGRRADVEGVDAATGTPFPAGYDFFFLSAGALAALPPSRFRIGAPWWDYWLPVSQIMTGCATRQLQPPAVRHERHAVAWHPAMFQELGLHLWEKLLSLRHDGLTDAAIDIRLYARVLENMLARAARAEGGGASEQGASAAYPFGRLRPAVQAFNRTLMEGEARADAGFATFALVEFSRSVLEFIDECSADARLAMKAPP